MRGKVFVFLLLLAALPTTGFGQSTLNFPKFFSAAELPLSGFAVVNPNSTTASITFTLYSATGTVVSTSVQSLAAGNQRARSGNELFTNLGTGGWVQATSTTSGLQGFWLNYSGDISYIDGAEAALATADQVVPLVAGTTELNVANPTNASNSVTIRLFGEAGTELGTAVTQSIAANGVYQASIATIFPTATLANARYIRVTGSATVASCALVRGYLVPTDTAVVNGTNKGSSNTSANFPHVVSGVGGGGNYTTEVGIVNLAAAAQTISISFTPEAGGTATTVTRDLAANGSIRATAQSLFSFNPAVFQNGWIRVTGTAGIAGFVAYADSVAGGAAVVGIQETPRTQMLFAHIADLSPFYTGVALLNTNSTAATIAVSAMTPDGTLIGTQTITLAAGAKTAKLLLELVPATQSRTSDGGFLFVSSNVSLYGIELFFNRNLSSLSNVAAGALATGITYSPPLPITITAATPSPVIRLANLTVTGTNFNTTAASNTVTFTTVSGTVDATASAATATSLTVAVPATAITGPITVRSGSATSTGTVIVTVATSATAQVQSSISITAGGTTANADIYVTTTTSSTPLNLTTLGVIDAGATTVAFSDASVEITAGTSKTLVLSGTGMSETAGSTVTISGAGLTLTNPRFNSGFLLVDVAVAATAVKGGRNIVVTNSNLDTTVFTGGFIIK